MSFLLRPTRRCVEHSLAPTVITKPKLEEAREAPKYPLHLDDNETWPIPVCVTQDHSGGSPEDIEDEESGQCRPRLHGKKSPKNIVSAGRRHRKFRRTRPHRVYEIAAPNVEFQLVSVRVQVEMISRQHQQTGRANPRTEAALKRNIRGR